MIGIGRGLLLAFSCALGLVLGLGGFLTLGLTRVAPAAIAPPAATQEWGVTLELGDTFLAERINAGGGGNPIALRDVRVTSRDDGTILLNATVSPARGGTATPTAGRPGLPIPLPIGPPGGGNTPLVPGEILLRPGVQGGQVKVDVVRASLGPLPLPANLGRLLEDPINSQVGNAVQNEPFRVIEVTTRQGAVLVRAARTRR